MTIRGLLVAAEEYDTLSGLPTLDGTVQRALDFRTWLVDTKGADPEDVILCSSPRHPISRFDATRQGVVDAILHLLTVGKDETRELFVFQTGHGFRHQDGVATEPVDVLVGAEYQPMRGGEGCLKVPQLRTFLARALGPGVHVWFIDACRVDSDFDVPDLVLPGGVVSVLGEADTNWVFDTTSGAAARSESVFVPLLISGLAGEGRAKEFISGRYWVTFDRLVDTLQEAAKAEASEIDSRAGRNRPALLYSPTSVARVHCRVEVEDADATDNFVARVWGPPQNATIDFVGATTDIEVLPGDYSSGVAFENFDIERVSPTGNTVEIYEPIVLRFRKGEAPSPPAELTFAVEDNADVSFQIAGPTGTVVADVPAGRSVPLSPGKYDVSLIHSGYQVGTAALALESGAHVEPSVDRITNPSPAFLAVRRRVALPNTSFAVDLDQLMAQPGDKPDAMVDPDPALVLTTLGAAAVCDVAPYTELIAALPTFEDVQPGGAAFFVLDTPAGGGEVEAGGVRATLDPVADLDPIACAILPASLGPQLITIRHPALGEMLLSTIALANRATMIIIARGNGPLAIRQHALPIGHLAEELYDGGDIPMSQYGLLHAITFANRVQAVYEGAGTQQVSGSRAFDKRDEVFARAVIQGRWPDPITPLMAAFDTVRRGFLPRSPALLRQTANRLRQEFGNIADLDVLSAINEDGPLQLDHYPLLQYALAAATGITPSLELNRHMFSLVHDSPWVQFQRARVGLPQYTTNWAQTPAATADLADEIAKLADLRDRGVLTDEEFQAQKKSLGT